MPPRRSHKKSKAGCQRCKQRKIKCDEVHPLCGNCSKHGVSCDFDGAGVSPASNSSPLVRQNTSNSSSASSPHSHSVGFPLYQSPTDLVRSGQSPIGSRQLELKLMHHYTASTCTTLSVVEAQRTAWQVDIPAIAYGAQYLMDAILAVAALHLRSIHPDDQNLVRASHGYMASALQQYSSLLNGGLSEDNAEALFSTSALIAFQASASRRFDDDQKDGGYILPLAWFHSFQGIKAVVIASWQWLRNSEKVIPIISGQPALILDLDPSKTSFFASLLEGMDEQVEHDFPDYMQDETKRAYKHAVAFLNWAHMNPGRSRILGFAATVSRRFVELIGQQDPRALVIISCFFAMIKVVDDVWWLQGVAKREVMGIMSLLPQEWWPKMEWPLRVANCEDLVSDEIWGVPFRTVDSEGRQVKIEDTSDGDVHRHIDMLAAIINEQAPPPLPD